MERLGVRSGNKLLTGTVPGSRRLETALGTGVQGFFPTPHQQQ